MPLKKGRCGTLTHDYKRHGTTTLFAAMELLQGKVIGLYDNTKEQADIILEACGEDLKQHHGVKEVVNFRGIHYSKPAPLETLEEMARKLGARVSHIEAPFEPEAGAYGHHHE